MVGDKKSCFSYFLKAWAHIIIHDWVNRFLFQDTSSSINTHSKAYESHLSPNKVDGKVYLDIDVLWLIFFTWDDCNSLFLGCLGLYFQNSHKRIKYESRWCLSKCLCSLLLPSGEVMEELYKLQLVVSCPAPSIRQTLKDRSFFIKSLEICQAKARIGKKKYCCSHLFSFFSNTAYRLVSSEHKNSAGQSHLPNFILYWLQHKCFKR